MKDKIIEIISKITQKEQGFLLSSINVLNLWDSFTHVEIVIALEEEFDICFTQDEIASMTTLSEIISIIESKAK